MEPNPRNLTRPERLLPFQVVAFRGFPRSLVEEFDHAYRRSSDTVAVCMCTDATEAYNLRNFWFTRIQPRHPTLNLIILRSPPEQYASVFVEYLSLLTTQRHDPEVDILIVSTGQPKEELHWLTHLRQILDRELPASVLRRV